MTKLVLLFILFFSINSTPIFGQYKKIKEEKLTIIENKYSYKNAPLKGHYHIRYKKPNDHLSEKVNFVDGLKNDTMSTIFRFGKKEKTGAYVNGLREGKWTEFMYSSGRVLKVSNYKKDLKEGMELDFLFGKDTLYYKSDKLNGWQSFDRYNTEKKYYDNGVLKKSIETNLTHSFIKECNYLADRYECKSERKYQSVIRKEKITGNYKNEFEKKTTINDTIEHKIFVQKIETENSLKFIADFYRNNQQYEKWEIIIPTEHYFNKEKSEGLLNDDSYRVEYFSDNKKISTAYKLDCEIYESLLVYNHKVDFFVYDFSQDRYGNYIKNFRKYKLKMIDGDGDMLGGCIPEYVEGNE